MKPTHSVFESLHENHSQYLEVKSPEQQCVSQSKEFFLRLFCFILPKSEISLSLFLCSASTHMAAVRHILFVFLPLPPLCIKYTYIKWNGTFYFIVAFKCFPLSSCNNIVGCGRSNLSLAHTFSQHRNLSPCGWQHKNSSMNVRILCLHMIEWKQLIWIETALLWMFGRCSRCFSLVWQKDCSVCFMCVCSAKNSFGIFAMWMDAYNSERDNDDWCVWLWISVLWRRLFGGCRKIAIRDGALQSFHMICDVLCIEKARRMM